MKPGFRVDSSKPYAAAVNRELAALDGQQFQSLFNGARSAYAADQLAGTIIPDTDIAWNAATGPQQLIAIAYNELGLDRSTLQAELEANRGPAGDPRYLTYEGWGLVPGVAADPSLEVVDGVVRTGPSAGVRLSVLRIPA